MVFKCVSEGCEHGVNFGVKCYYSLVDFGAVDSVRGESKVLVDEGSI